MRVLQRDDSVLITWTPLTPEEAQGDITGYQVALTHNNTQTTMSVNDPWLQTSQLVQGRVYTVRVAAMTEAGPGPFSFPVLLDVQPKEVPPSEVSNTKTVLYAPPQPTWLVYLLIPVVLAISAATLYYVWRLRGKSERSSNPPNALTLYEDPSMYSNHQSVNIVYGDLKLLHPSDSDRESRVSSKNYISPESVNEYAEPRIGSAYDVTEPYATTALLEHVPDSKQHNSDDSGVQVNWASMIQQSYPLENIEMSDASAGLRGAYPTPSVYAGHNGLEPYEFSNMGTNSFKPCGVRQVPGDRFHTFNSIQAQAVGGGLTARGPLYPRPSQDPQDPSDQGSRGSSNTH